MSENQPVVVPPGTGVPVPQNSSKAVVSLVFGVVGFILLPLIAGIVAVVVGYNARKEIRESAGMLSGDGMATAGIILGWVNIGLTVLGICIGTVILLGVFTALGNIRY
jgi:Domain of unknown function (DUF4190)